METKVYKVVASDGMFTYRFVAYEIQINESV